MPDGNLIGVLLNAGLAGLVLLLFLRGWITPKPGVDQMAREADRWRKLYETERAAHNLTRKANACTRHSRPTPPHTAPHTGSGSSPARNWLVGEEVVAGDGQISR